MESEYDLDAALSKFVERMTRGVKVGLQPQKLREVLDLATEQLPGVTRENAELWIVLHKSGDGRRGLAVNIKGNARERAFVVPITGETFVGPDYAALATVYQMMDPRYSDD